MGLTGRQRSAAIARAHRCPGFTPEGLEKLRAAALERKPWLNSTGPRTESGKSRSRMNAFKGGFKSRLRSFQVWRRDLSGWLSALDTEAARGDIASAIQRLRLVSVAEPDPALIGSSQDPVRQDPNLDQKAGTEGEEV
jgi:hypothetical protein